MAADVQNGCVTKSFSAAILELANMVKTLELSHDSELKMMTSAIAELRAGMVLNSSSHGTFSESIVDVPVSGGMSYGLPGRQMEGPCIAQPLQQAAPPGADEPNSCVLLQFQDAPGDASHDAIAGQALSAGIVSGASLRSVDVSEAEVEQQAMMPEVMVSSDPEESLAADQAIADGSPDEHFSDMQKAVSDCAKNFHMLADPCDQKTEAAAATPFGDRMRRAIDRLSMRRHSQDKTESDPIAYRLLGRTINSESQTGTSTLRKLMANPIVDLVVAAMIIANAVVMGLEVQDDFSNPSTSAIYGAVDIFFNAFFLCEILLRVKAFHCRSFVCGEEASWNIFDCCLICVGWSAILSRLVSNSSDQLENAKALKMLRVLRVFRVLRFFRQLAQFTVMVLSSLRQLFWAMVLFSLINYIAALTLADGAAKWLRVETQDFVLPITANSKIEAVHKRFGGVQTSCYTLFQVALGGVSWGEVTDVALDMSWIYFTVLCLYITFIVIAVLNVFTGVFVEEALQQKQRQIDVLIESKISQRDDFMTKIRDFFSVVDEDGDGTISFEEVREMLQDPSLSAYFDVLGFRTHDAERMFDLLDSDGSGTIGSAEFIEGCDKITGSARGIDLHFALTELKRLRAITKQTLDAITKDGMCDTGPMDKFSRRSVLRP